MSRKTHSKRIGFERMRRLEKIFALRVKIGMCPSINEYV